MRRRFVVGFFLLVGACALAATGYRLAPATSATNAGRLVGSAVDFETGALLPAEVAVSQVAGRQITLRHVMPSPSGEFASDGLPPGTYHLATKLDGYAPEHRSVVLGEGQTLRVDFRLKKTKLVRGVVQDPSGAPLADASVRLVYRADARGQGGFVSTYQWETGDVKTDIQGRFEVEAHPDKAFVVEALHPDFAGVVSAPARIKPGQQEAQINLRLAKGVRVDGKVLDARGDPVPGARVRLTELGVSPAPPEFAASEVLGRRSKESFSDNIGSFGFNKVRAARLRVIVLHPSYKVYTQTLSAVGAEGPTSLSVVLTDKR